MSFSGNRSLKKENLFLEPQSKRSLDGVSINPINNKPSSRKTSLELQKTPPKPEIEKSEQLLASDRRKISLSEDKAHIFEQKPIIFSDFNSKIANIENTPNHENLPKSFENPTINESTPKKTPASPKSSDNKPNEINPFLTPQNQIISESLTDYISKASGAGIYATVDTSNNTVNTSNNTVNVNIEKNPFLLPNNTQLFQNFSNNNAMNPETPTNNSNTPFNNSNYTVDIINKTAMGIIQETNKPIFSDFTAANTNATVTMPNTLVHTTPSNSLGNFGFPLSSNTQSPAPDFYSQPPKLLQENSYLSQNSTASNGLFAGLLGQNPGVPATFTSGFATKPSGGIFGNLLANSSVFDSFKQNNPSEGGGIFGGLLAGMKESSTGSGVSGGSKSYNKKKKPRVNS